MFIEPAVCSCYTRRRCCFSLLFAMMSGKYYLQFINDTVSMHIVTKETSTTFLSNNIKRPNRGSDSNSTYEKSRWPNRIEWNEERWRQSGGENTTGKRLQTSGESTFLLQPNIQLVGPRESSFWILNIMCLHYDSIKIWHKQLKPNIYICIYRSICNRMMVRKVALPYVK